MKKKIKWKKIVLIMMTVFGVVMVAAGSYAWNLVTSTFMNIQENIERQEAENRLASINFDEGDPFSMLLMGIDEPNREAGDFYHRSDTLVYVTINPEKNSTQMVSIPRDTYTELVGYDKKDKINHSYAFGGTEMTIRTVENFLDVPVDYFVRIDMKGFKGMVDAVGGVEVENEFDFRFEGKDFEEGPLQLNGEDAWKFARMRLDDPRGDFGRQERQRQIIQELVDKGMSFSSITRIEEILSVVENNIRTNLSLGEIWSIQSNYRDALNTIEEHEIAGEDGEMDEVYYYIPDEEKVQELSEILKEHLELNE
ncbi:LCP family protein [Alkalihalobacillus sp. MEB130]|uniref:LCP family glycopolymer transferase n=1 Tax=Alkalihalobacillus sp. MEB130 TaxID=2976704 RepID=UPI0028DD9C80|nr:LCP family protein [Alkalihalobacillus sp. MEB130]MDT8863064.1 LCP family protein [Alkalihalobacillus sp. MEB130]